MLCFSGARTLVSLWYQGFGEVGFLRDCTRHDNPHKLMQNWNKSYTNWFNNPVDSIICTIFWGMKVCGLVGNDYIYIFINPDFVYLLSLVWSTKSLPFGNPGQTWDNTLGICTFHYFPKFVRDYIYNRRRWTYQTLIYIDVCIYVHVCVCVCVRMCVCVRARARVRVWRSWGILKAEWEINQ